jgi:hypothetical protein
MKGHTSGATFAIAAVLAALVGGGAALVASTSGGTTSVASREDEGPSFTGSVSVPAAIEAQELPGDQERAALRELATVSPQQAGEAALGVVHGTVGHTEMDEENGSVVYRVLVDGFDGTVSEVTVDVGTAEVLARQVHHTDRQD